MHDGPTLCKAVLMQESGRLLALGVAAGLLWMHAFHRQQSLVVMSTTEEEAVASHSVWAPGLRTQPMTTPLRCVKDVGVEG
jgi:hypothetical protein